VDDVDDVVDQDDAVYKSQALSAIVTINFLERFLYLHSKPAKSFSPEIDFSQHEKSLGFLLL
jgi:hypothetical protein